MTLCDASDHNNICYDYVMNCQFNSFKISKKFETITKHMLQQLSFNDDIICLTWFFVHYHYDVIESIRGIVFLDNGNIFFFKYFILYEPQPIDDIAFKKKQMHSGRWGLSRETISLLSLRHNHFSCRIFFCLIPQPIPQCITRSSNTILSI